MSERITEQSPKMELSSTSRPVAATLAAEELRSDDLEAVRKLKSAFANIKEQLGRIIVGQTEVIEELLISLFSRAGFDVGRETSGACRGAGFLVKPLANFSCQRRQLRSGGLTPPERCSEQGSRVRWALPHRESTVCPMSDESQALIAGPPLRTTL
jgi:hypothetical protein